MIQPSFDYDFDFFDSNNNMSNKLFCTFSTEEELDSTLETIQSKYQIIYNKILLYQIILT